MSNFYDSFAKRRMWHKIDFLEEYSWFEIVKISETKLADFYH